MAVLWGGGGLMSEVPLYPCPECSAPGLSVSTPRGGPVRLEAGLSLPLMPRGGPVRLDPEAGLSVSRRAYPTRDASGSLLRVDLLPGFRFRVSGFGFRFSVFERERERDTSRAMESMCWTASCRRAMAPFICPYDASACRRDY